MTTSTKTLSFRLTTDQYATARMALLLRADDMDARADAERAAETPDVARAESFREQAVAARAAADALRESMAD